MVELDLWRTRTVLVGVPDRPDGTVDLLVDGRLFERATTTGGDVVRVDPTTGGHDVHGGSAGTVRFTDLPAGEKDVEIWLPHYERTEIVALRTDAPILPAQVGSRRVWLHHGSSISQGSSVSRDSHSPRAPLGL